jgi:hypothetical protein
MGTMTKNQMSLRAAVAIGLAVPATLAWGQYTGTSHPDDVPITTSGEGVRQPMVYAPATPAPAPVTMPPTMATEASAPPLKPRASAPNTWTDPDSMVVGDQPMSATARERMIAPGDGAVGGDGLRISGRADLQRSGDLDANVVTRVAGPANGLPVGTLVKTRMLQGFSTQTTVEGSEWRAELLEPLTRDGQVLIPAGAVMRGRVTEVHGGKRISGEASIHLEPLAVTLPDGTTLGMHAQVIDTNLYRTTKVDNEGTILRRDHKKEDGGILALTTGSGAAAGAMIGGVPGALIGAGVGAGVSTALWLKQDRQAELPKDTQVTFELTRLLKIGGE